MTKGFGSKNCQSADEIVYNLRHNRKLLRNNFAQKRDAFKSGWLAQYQNNQYEKSPEYSLYKPYSEHSCLIAEKPSKHSTVGHHNEKLLFFANTDFWSVLVKQYNLKNKLSSEYSYNGELYPRILRQESASQLVFQFSTALRTGSSRRKPTSTHRFLLMWSKELRSVVSAIRPITANFHIQILALWIISTMLLILLLRSCCK